MGFDAHGIATGKPHSEERWAIGVLLGSGILVSFLDRINLSVAGPQLQKALALDPLQMGYLFSAYSWTYTVLQIPVGSFVDRVGVTRIGAMGILSLDAGVGNHRGRGGFWGIVAARLLLGVAEAPLVPHRLQGHRPLVPRNERARATAIFDAAAKFSNVLGIPVIAFAVVRFGLALGLRHHLRDQPRLLRRLLRPLPGPERRPAPGPAEHDYILKGAPSPRALRGGGPGHAGLPPRPSPRSGAGHRVRAYGYSFYLFLTWLPGYLVATHGMSNPQLGRYAATRGPWRP